LPELPPIPSTGLPANLLLRRPDLRAASLRVAAADHRVASAVADRLPALRLTASSGWQSFTPAEKLFDSTLWTIAGNVAAPLIDGGRRRAEVDRTKAVVDELLHEYSEAFLGAVQEVEDALVSEREQRKHLAALGDQVRFSGRALGEAQLRYVTGLSDYLPVLAALQTLQEAERLQLTARRDLVGFRIQLYRALGGTWTNELDRPERVAGAAS
jgi:outer membrane protein TolC